MVRLRYHILFASMVVLAVVLAGCGGAATSSPSARATTAPPATSLPAATATNGPPVVLVHTKSAMVAGSAHTLLANVQGKTLYYFTADSATQIACSGSCAQLWPPLLVPSGTPASSPALPGQLTVVSGANGPQVAYNGHPLYTFSKDQDAGDVYGQGVAGKWFAATPTLAP